MNWEHYGFVIRGGCRKSVVLALDIERTPSQIAKITKMNNSHVSRALIELKKKRVVKCLNPKNITGRVYALTEEGKQIKNHLKKSMGQGS